VFLLYVHELAHAIAELLVEFVFLFDSQHELLGDFVHVNNRVLDEFFLGRFQNLFVEVDLLALDDVFADDVLVVLVLRVGVIEWFQEGVLQKLLGSQALLGVELETCIDKADCVLVAGGLEGLRHCSHFLLSPQGRCFFERFSTLQQFLCKYADCPHVN